MHEHFEGTEFVSSYNRDEKLQSLSPDQILNLGKTALKIDLTDTTNVLNKISVLSLSEKMSDQELGMKIARFHEAYLKAKTRTTELTSQKQPPVKFKRVA